MLLCVEKKKFQCAKCKQIGWQRRRVLSEKGTLLVVVFAPLTLGLSLLLLLCYSDRFSKWECGWCAARAISDSTYSYSLDLPAKQSKIEKPSSPSRPNPKPASSSPSSEQTTRPSWLPTEEQQKTVIHRDGETLPHFRTFKPTGPPHGAFSNKTLEKPPKGCTLREYWTWHDTLYLGGSSRSPEWRARAKEAKERDGFKCVECGGTENLETDHIIPLSKNGSNDLENLQTLCHACHENKSGREFPDINKSN